MLYVLYVTPTPQRTESYAQGDLRPGPAAQRDGEKARRSVCGLRPVDSGTAASAGEGNGPQPLATELVEYGRQRRRGSTPGAARAVVVRVVKQGDHRTGRQPRRRDPRLRFDGGGKAIEVL